MKLLKLNLMLCLLAASTAFFSCSKSNDTKPATTTNGLGALNSAWNAYNWGGVSGNYINFTISADGTTGVITSLGSDPSGFSVGDNLLTDIKVSGSGYTATGKYTYGTNNASSSTRAAILSLQNNNTQLTIDYPALNASFPEIIYIYQKGMLSNN